jgi:transglutaminase-like putative cysteine protease
MEKMPDPLPERQDLDDYLRCDDIIDHDDTLIEETAEQITEGLRDNISRAQAIYEFVRDHIFHSFQINATSITIKASEVLEKGHGICYAQAHLLAALMRAAGIPCGLCYQVRKDKDDPDGRLVVHGYNAVYIEEIHKWVRLDASKGIDEYSPPFDFEKEASDLEVNTNAGEFDDPVIYINPSRIIVKSLKKYETIEDLKKNMPDKY